MSETQRHYIDDGLDMNLELEDSEPDFSSSSSESDATLPSDDNEIWDVSDLDSNSNDSNNCYYFNICFISHFACLREQ